MRTPPLMSYKKLFIIFNSVQVDRELGSGGSHCSSSVQIRAIAFYTGNASFYPGKMDSQEVETSVPVNTSLRTATFGFLCWKDLIFVCYPSFKSLTLLTCITNILVDAVDPINDDSN